MAYSKLLAKIIAETNYTQDEIAQKCCELGVKVRREKINALVNNRESPPDDEISRAIAKVCNVDERKLVLEGYIDTAPKEIKDILETIRNFIYLSTISATSILGITDRKSINIIEDYLKNEPLSDTLIELIDSKEDSIKFIENNFNMKINSLGKEISIKNPNGIEVKDNGMSPLIEEGNKIVLDFNKKCDISDIVAFKSKNDKDIKVRILSKNNDTFIMIPLNSKYDREIYSKEDISIIGKVDNVIKKI